MTREEHDREDLLREARALVERLEMVIPGREEPVLVGFRRDGGASFYLTAARVYQFTSAGALRRAFVDGLIFKAEARQLVSLRRERSDQMVALVRHVLSSHETSAFLAEMRAHLEALNRVLSKAAVQITGQVPEDANLVARIRCWLDEFADHPELADSPRAR